MDRSADNHDWGFLEVAVTILLLVQTADQLFPSVVQVALVFETIAATDCDWSFCCLTTFLDGTALTYCSPLFMLCPRGDSDGYQAGLTEMNLPRMNLSKGLSWVRIRLELG